MGSTVEAIKILVIPAVISLILFVTGRYVLVPMWRTYRQRYSQYLPLDSLSNHTVSLRQRLQGAYSGMLAPTWRRRFRARIVVGGGRDDDDDDDVENNNNGRRGADRDADDSDEYTSEEGEELADVDVESWSSAARTGGRTDVASSDRRLSRDLEEGFMSDSDDDDDGRHRQNYRR
ncbi:unnamed protein product [Parascedosporium putredinis]|uniref:Uncharacterized protein n=1 Tax=Parascedosporium putredinis TaxID=1442378 RepID=A0A9P1GZJ4_9PEZI|nr:unnamed protein product [Parascedosporium putredinis]CAI7992951.1 unnamed protein product [Parascedosporium putredinis]